MQKKTIKIFLNSFIVSLFTMWTVNKLFVIPSEQAGGGIVIPEKNIALFFQDEAPTINYAASTTPVDSFLLNTPSPQPLSKNIFIDENLFVFDEPENVEEKKPEEKAFRISSIEDAADIPLEYIETTPNSPDFESEEPLIIANDSENNFLPRETTNETASLNLPVESEKETAAVDISPLDTFAANTLPFQNNDERIDIIPLEIGNAPNHESIVEIAGQAPENQIAMADGGKIDIDSIAVEQKQTLEEKKPQEWYEMKDIHSETDSPWVVAKGTRNPRNRQVLDEEFYKGMNEEEITSILNKPKNIAEEDKEVRVAEMVKNILIPIPEDILNDENLTPQLVSPKKNQKNAEKAQEKILAEKDTNPKEKGGILKSITSIFKDSDADATSTEKESGDDSYHEKRSGLFSVFSRDKTSVKILPAEMRLSFQPGRAEISGTTLRWIEAFANKVNDDPAVILEVRIDRTSSFDLQQKRLNLLYNILINKGVDYEKINTVFTTREPNSFIIRTLRINENVGNNIKKNDNRRALYYQSW